MKITLKHIAEETGFSLSTISRAIRGEGRISPQNRKKIITAAQRLGYVLPTSNRSLPDTFPTYVALITNFRTGEFYSSFFVGFQEAALKKNVSLSLFSVAEGSISLKKLITECKVMGYKGAVLFIPNLNHKDYEEVLKIEDKDFPIISCSNIDGTIMDTVTFDGYQGGYLVAKHFHEQGYQRYGLVEGPGYMPESRFRSNGFIDYVTHMAKSDVVWRFQGDYTLESGTAAFKAFLAADQRPDAVFVGNDAMAVGFMEVARREGYEIPKEVAVVGYDNLPICETHYPTLSSVDTDYTSLADNALSNLLMRIQSPIKHQGLVSLVPVKVKERDSSCS